MDHLRSGAERLARAWRTLGAEQRLAAVAATLLALTLFLPWYEKSVVVRGDFVEDKLTGFGSADFVLASVVLVAAAVLGMMFLRGERRGFHLPGGDGTVVTAAGAWAAVLIFYRVLDHPDVGGRGATIGIQWGVFVAFLAAALVVFAGLRIRNAHRPEPPLPTEEHRPRRPTRPPEEEAETVRVRRRTPPPPRDERPAPGQMSFDEAETQIQRRRRE